MHLTDTQIDLLTTAYALYARGCGMVIADDAYPDAHDLAELGWLERRFEPSGEMSWCWTPQAETAIDTVTLIDNATRGREN